MRFFIAFLLCFSFQVVAANAAEHGKQLCVQKVIKSTHSTTFKSKPVRQKSGFLNSRFLEDLDCTSQANPQHFNLAFTEFDGVHDEDLFTVEPACISPISEKQLAYSFILGFLYPKHSFW